MEYGNNTENLKIKNFLTHENKFFSLEGLNYGQKEREQLKFFLEKSCIVLKFKEYYQGFILNNSKLYEIKINENTKTLFYKNKEIISNIVELTDMSEYIDSNSFCLTFETKINVKNVEEFLNNNFSNKLYNKRLKDNNDNKSIVQINCLS